MKNFFGIIFILGGVGLIGLGIVALTDNHTRSQTFGDRWNSSFNQSYSRQKEEQQMIGMASAGGGAVLLIVGLVMVSKKSKKTKKKEAELAALKNLEAKQLKEKQIQIKAKAEAEAKVAAEQAQRAEKPVQETKDKIETPIIAKESGKEAVPETKDVDIKIETQTVQKAEDDLESKMAKIERLGELKEKGLLTEEEFAAEKKKILEA